ncbi:MAG: hypothetical protein GYA52_11550 [Chloroflexi bacterium]|nr:hypothetical protein [Chloroflexota bacterium]
MEVFTIVLTDHEYFLQLRKNAPILHTETDAWQRSIQKWEFLYHCCMQGQLVGAGGVQTCGLCALYFYGHDTECEDCPINLAGHPACAGTPSKTYQTAFTQQNIQLATVSARDEIRFLKGLAYGSGL